MGDGGWGLGMRVGNWGLGGWGLGLGVGDWGLGRNTPNPDNPNPNPRPQPPSPTLVAASPTFVNTLYDYTGFG
jgi:hypothetical protein